MPAAVAVLAVTTLLGGVHPATARPTTAGSHPVPGTRVDTVTLITGDRVRLTGRSGTEIVVGVEPAPGRAHIGFLRRTHTGRNGTDISIVPADAEPLLAARRLDPRLFDVTELRRQGLADASPTLPLIVTYAPTAGVPAAPATAPATAGATRALPSINGAAIATDRRHRGEFWRWLTTSPGPRATAAAPTLDPAITGVWLDARARPTLDVSAPQIGAPTAWSTGLTGAGVTVGILDTGVKADHPDLAGKVVEARDFTGTRPDAGDDVGHGTHVAGIIAGTGAASDGKYRGVAPDAKLISAKVCVAYGCPDSAVIAAMEWIAPKVRVVNLSLGGDASDGTDPVSQAVNTLTARYGTLFVAAAGNDRSLDAPDPLASITAPAAADAALAVGSVTGQDRTSPFSPTGPRRGDYAIKPDVAAPGSDIVSARAPGTPAGDLAPVDAAYTTMSGTSMAAPHVAGAAAILAQQHPDWTAGRLKHTLTGTATPTAGVFDQGAGRVDVARAVTQTVSTTSGSLTYGAFTWPHNQAPATRTVTYRNDGTAAVTLTLHLTVTGPDGKPAPAGLFTAQASQVTVPAHGSADVGVTVDPAAGGAGLYGGRLTAAATGVTVQTALDAFVEPESHTLNVRLVSRTGHFSVGVGQVVDTRTGVAYGIRFAADGTGTARLPRARYDLNAFDLSTDPTNPDRPYTVTLLSRTDLAVDADTTVTLDATAGRPVDAVVDNPAARRQSAEMGVVSGNPAGDRTTATSWLAGPQHQLFAVPTGPKVTDHTYASFFRTALAADRPGTDPAAPVYQLAFLERGRIPTDSVHRVHDRDLAAVDTRYHTQGAPASGVRADYALFSVPGAGSGVFNQYGQALPSRRTEYYTASPDVTWEQVGAVGPADESDIEISWSYRSYRPGRYQTSWNRAPLGPAFGDPRDGWGVLRAGNNLQVAVTLLSASDPYQYTSPPFSMTGTTTLTREGTVVATSPAPGVGTFPIPDAPGTYTLRATATRTVPWSVIGTTADVAWTFHEPGAAAPATPLPLIVVRAAGDVDDAGRAPAGRPYTLSLTAQHQPGAPVTRLAALQVEASFDDGTTWARVPTGHVGDNGWAVLRHPARGGFVSLRITARDVAGNSVTQTVIRAYQMTSRG
ncbi:S8 family serine peptidase [Planosporangium sp. 12N6]|uniref:S8 family serine peptidase n=1 Tax=Planosporangium spinosum TaxID=3402278 RepID=UPI003CF7696C